jgi:hypothetical protein
METNDLEKICDGDIKSLEKLLKKQISSKLVIELIDKMNINSEKYNQLLELSHDTYDIIRYVERIKNIDKCILYLKKKM